jgi:starch synthase
MDPQELAGALLTLIEDPALRSRFGAAGRQRALREFTWDRAARQVADIHNLIVTRSA